MDVGSYGPFLVFGVVVLLGGLAFLATPRAGAPDSPDTDTDKLAWRGPFYVGKDDPRLFVPIRVNRVRRSHNATAPARQHRARQFERERSEPT
ncbi:hypothetical protein AB0H83_14495 [Dactylosporangium sp. NPDC050688]|uniref:hypothetical protein n=1 Tax=Dactylosporangium sp. NPDC050688 TaxID=3157217 RepID=UPI0034083F00